jgi:hypothetical protein
MDTDHDCTSEPLVGHADGVASVQGRSAPVVHKLSFDVKQDQKLSVDREFKSKVTDLWTGIVEKARRWSRSLPVKVLVPMAFERRRDELLKMGITAASHALKEESGTADNEPPRVRYIEELLSKLEVFPVAWRNPAKKRKKKLKKRRRS